MGCIGLLVLRCNAVFNPPKIRAAIVAICAALFAIPMFMMGGFAGIEFGLASLICSFYYGCVWLYKHNRDLNLTKVAAPQAPVEQVIEISSPGSGRYYVPPPIDRPS